MPRIKTRRQASKKILQKSPPKPKKITKIEYIEGQARQIGNFLNPAVVSAYRFSTQKSYTGVPKHVCLSQRRAILQGVANSLLVMCATFKTRKGTLVEDERLGKIIVAPKTRGNGRLTGWQPWS